MSNVEIYVMCSSFLHRNCENMFFVSAIPAAAANATKERHISHPQPQVPTSIQTEAAPQSTPAQHLIGTGKDKAHQATCTCIGLWICVHFFLVLLSKDYSCRPSSYLFPQLLIRSVHLAASNEEDVWQKGMQNNLCAKSEVWQSSIEAAVSIKLGYVTCPCWIISQKDVHKPVTNSSILWKMHWNGSVNLVETFDFLRLTWW